MDNKTMGSMAERLLNFVDTAQVHDSNFDIALTMVKNYNTIKKMTLREMAALCYVSQASISRFCRFMGYESFKEFHAALEQDFKISDDYTRQFHSLLKSNSSKALTMYREQLIDNINLTMTEENLRVLPRVLEILRDSKRVAFFSHHFLWDIGHFFQGRMIMLDRYVELFQPYEEQLNCAKSLDDGCAAFICTMGGSYFTLYKPIIDAIHDSGAKVVVLTQNIGSPFINRADYVLRCGISNQNDIGKYSALMIIDYIVMCYMRENGNV